MKKRLLSVVLLVIYNTACAQEYKLAEVENIVQNFFAQKIQKESRNETLTSTINFSLDSITRNGIKYMYIANAENSTGWVVVSNEKKYPAIIAYADSGTFVYEKENLPPALVYILETHMDVLDSVRNNSLQMEAISKRLNQTPLTNECSPNYVMDIAWSQSKNADGDSADCDKVYNKFCPRVLRDTCRDIFDEDWSKVGTCNRKLAGCGAIAMAQLMKYWQWPDYATISNTTYYYDWENMPNYIDNNTGMYQVNEVARLIENCRTAAKSFGGCIWTAAEMSKIHDAMIDIFGYHSNLVNANEDVHITAMLVYEIKQKRPVLVQGWRDGVGKAHTFIVDGYRIDDHDNNGINDTTYHINFGWGGANNNDYWDLSFSGYYKRQKFLVELYPKCTLRNTSISLDNTFTIVADDNRTYYSTNTITFCNNNNSIAVNSGGHLLVRSGYQVRLKDGFHAKAGSNVHIMINDTLCNSSTTETSSTSQRFSPQSFSSIIDDTDSPHVIETNNGIEDVERNAILSTSIYTISGQFISTIVGGLRETKHLPSGMYILQYRMSDGSIRSEKIANNAN